MPNKKGKKNQEITDIESAEIPTVQNGSEIQNLESVNSEGEITVVNNISLVPTVIEKNAFFNLLEKVKQLDSMQKTVSAVAKYWEATTEGEKKRGIFVRFRPIHKVSEKYKSLEEVPDEFKPYHYESDGKLYVNIDCFEFMGNDQRLWLIGGIQAVEAMRSICAYNGLPFEIVFTGKKNRTKIFDIIPLAA